jgi:hypothetical protein
MKKTVSIRNEHAAALRIRAGNAGTAVAVDTRPRVIASARRKSTRKSFKAQRWSCLLD